MYDAILVVSFGGPEGPNDVLPFLENVLRGKNVPRERMLEVEQHYLHFGGVSPINRQCRELIDALRLELDRHGIDLPIYFGNRNWHPMLADTLQQMAEDGKQHAIAFFTSTFSSYSGCRQYRENIQEAQRVVGPSAPKVDKLRMPYNHPGFIVPQQELLRQGLAKVPQDKRSAVPVLFTAHSIPLSMAENCNYEKQLREASRLIAEGVGHERWELVFQSRSGPPQQPWLEPDVVDRIEQLHQSNGIEHVIVQPIGFLSDHIEVLFDLDTEASEFCEERGIHLIRVPTIGIAPRFVSMIRELIQERMHPGQERVALGVLGPSHDVCPENCCLYPRGGRPGAS